MGKTKISYSTYLESRIWEKLIKLIIFYMNACSSPEVVHHKMFAIDSSKIKPSTGDDNFQKKVFGIMDFEGKMKIGIIANSFESLVDKGKDWKKSIAFNCNSKY